ncbi:hypothetical protein AGMMS49944_13090 [Spirochaetia bacterium]|nr:hypothetical protein AGMMS49944_13090 [Spirochaetia bacterium]
MKTTNILGAIMLMAFCGCGAEKITLGLNTGGGEDYESERAIVEKFIAGPEMGALGIKTAEKDKKPGILIDFFSAWKGNLPPGAIIMDKTYVVPVDEAPSKRRSAALADCLNGTERLVPLPELAAPFTALRVDDLSVDADNYPLVQFRGITIHAAGEAMEEKIKLLTAALGDYLAALYPPEETPEITWIASGGDVMLDRGAAEILFQEGPAGIFGKTAGMLAGADIALINLEGVVSSRGQKITKSFNFRFAPGVAATLKWSGIDAVLHANNHVYDYGADAFLDSLMWLKQAELGIVGAGRNDDEASDPFVMPHGGETYRVFGIASFPRERNGWDGVTAAAEPDKPGMLHSGKGGAEKLKAKLAAAPGSPVTDILLFHGGVEWSRSPDKITRDLYTELIRSGADLIIGSHPHVVQGFEWVLDKPVFWSLGNYVFGGMGNTDGGEEGLFIRLGFWRGKMVYLEPFALSLSHTRTDIAPEKNLADFYTLSDELKP